MKDRRTYHLSSWIFLRLLGLVYLAALISLWVQLEGLVGSRGILPAAPFLEAVAEQTGPERYLLLPTLCWLDAGDVFLHALCAAGVVLALLVTAGLLEVPALFGLWAIYLSLTTIGRDFLSFQWDVLLLETGLLAVFLFPPRLRARPGAPPSALALGLRWWLLLRLMFRSGVVKLVSGDETWRHLTALEFHYQTQPLPTWTAWLAHQLPAWFHSPSVAAMFAVELLAPWLILVPRLRRPAFAALVFLQVLIAATGNYGFFNLLALVLCVLLLDDACLRYSGGADPMDRTRLERWWRWVPAPLAAVVLVVTAVQAFATFRLRPEWPEPVLAVVRAAAPFRSINSYGLFAVMTTERPEIVVEGSADGREWRAYEFRWKPGDPGRRPRFVTPHMPRLDWQMWFAALGTWRQNPWFPAFLGRLGEGSPEVLALLRDNPFPERPPRYLRARLYDYRFTSPAERRASGAWWRRQERGLYFPAVPAQRLRR